MVLRDKDNADEKVYTFILKDNVGDGTADLYPDTNHSGGEREPGTGNEETPESDGNRQREPATLSWEYDFRVPRSDFNRSNKGDADTAVDARAECAGQETQEMKMQLKKQEKEDHEEEDEIEIFIPWRSFKPTYRGKEKRDAEPIDLKAIWRMSLMMRRYVPHSKRSENPRQMVSVPFLSFSCHPPW